MRKIFAFSSVGTAIAVAIVLFVSAAQPVLADGPLLVGISKTSNVYDAPNLSADLIGQLTAGQNWYIFGTDTTGNWIEVKITDSIIGWAPKSTFGVAGLTLPVIAGVTGGNVTPDTPSLANTAQPQTPSSVVTSVSSMATAVPTAIAQSASVTTPYLVTVLTSTNAYDTPSYSGNVVGVLTAGQTWFTLALDVTGNWTEIQLANTSIVFWVPVSTVSLNGVNLPYLVTVLIPTNAYAAPSYTANVLGVLLPGQTQLVLGVDTTQQWAEVVVPGTGATFWAQVAKLNLKGMSLRVIAGVTAF